MKKNSTKRIGLLFTFLSLYTLSSFAQTFYTTEFDGGLDGWTTINNSSADMPITGWAQVAEGTTTQFTGTINSTSAANGYALFDSFGQCIAQADIVPETKQDVWFASPIIDASAETEVWLTFETHHGKFNSANFLEVSTDGGVTFDTEIPIFTEAGVNDWSHGGARAEANPFNPHVVIIDLTMFAAGQSELVFAFRYLNDNVTVGGNTGNDFRCGYAWSIDDVSLSSSNPTAPHDLGLTEFFVAPNAVMPLSQADTIFFGGEVVNNGIEDQTNVMMNVDISTGGVSVYSGSFPVGTLEVGGVDTLAITTAEGFYVPVDTGTYTMSYSITADSTDLVPTDNTAETDFIISENRWAKEFGTGVQTIWATNLNRQGVLFDNFNPGDFATSIQFAADAVNGNDLAGQTVTLRVHEVPFGLTPYDDDNQGGAIGQNSYTFTQEDADANPALISVPILSSTTACPGIPLSPEMVYVVTIEYPLDADGAAVLAPYRSLSHTYDFQNEASVILRTADGGFFGGWNGGAVPLVRMEITADPNDFRPVAAFSAAGDPIVQFTENSEDSDNECDFEWDFGDGSSTSFSQNPSHEYTENGTYNVCLTVSNGDFGDSTSCQEITIVNGVSSTIDLADLNKIEIAPNPANDILRLNVEMEETAQNATIRIVDLTGKVLIENSFENVLNQQFTFDIQNFSAGTYFLHMRTEVGTTTQKFTVQK